MNPSNETKQEPLTPRETEILALIAKGIGSKQIAGLLSISGNTVANHRKNMLAKMRAKSSAELVFMYINNSGMGNSY
jgi:DNA-binding CsgD family transcriptional regulator